MAVRWSNVDEEKGDQEQRRDTTAAAKEEDVVEGDRLPTDTCITVGHDLHLIKTRSTDVFGFYIFEV